MLIFVYLVFTIALFYIGYILALNSSVAFVEPERVELVYEKLSSFKKKYLDEILDNPRSSLHLIIVFKALLLMATTLLAILSGNYLSSQFGWRLDITYIVGLFVIWVVYLIFIEILPRRRIMMPDGREMLKFVPFYVSVYIIFKPAVLLYTRIFAHERIQNVTEEQKEDIVERAIETLAEQAGINAPIVEDDEKEMIGQIFQLDVTEVREVMVPRVNMIGLDKNASLEDIKRITKEHGFSRYPVYDNNPDKIVGILYIKDLFTALVHEKGDHDLQRYIRKPLFVPEKKIISDLLAEFKSNKKHIAIVIDEFGGTSGLVTLEDILEEIVGEIQDEHDHETASMIKLPDNSYRVDAALSVEELLEGLNLEYDNGEFETVGGLIYDLVGSVPTIGTTMKWKDLIFEVENVDGQRIASIKVWLKKNLET
ncbi:MAG: hemolysin family protein [Candidatus Zixiibacteriota bacterium]